MKPASCVTVIGLAFASLSASGSAAPGGGWSYFEKVDNFTDEKIVTLTKMGAGKVIGAQVRCTGGKQLEVAFAVMKGGILAGSRGSASEVLLRSDNRPAITLSGAGRMETVRFMRDFHQGFEDLVSELRSARSTFRVGVRTVSGSFIEDEFGSPDSDGGLSRVIQACAKAKE